MRFFSTIRVPHGNHNFQTMSYLIVYENRKYFASCIKYPEHPNTWFHFQLNDGSNRIVRLRSSAVLSNLYSRHFTDFPNIMYSSQDCIKLNYLILALESFVHPNQNPNPNPKILSDGDA